MIRSRPWTLWLWSVTLALSVAGADRAWREALARGRERSALLVPAGQPPPHRRDEAEKSLETYPEVASAEWLSPSALALEATLAFSRGSLPEIFPDEEAWLPWILEVRFRDPFAQARIGARIADLGDDPAWRLVLWDGPASAEDARAARRALLLGGSLVAFLAFGGFQALRLGPARRGRFVHESVIGAFATCATVAAFGGVARYAGDAPDARAWIVGLGAGLALSGVLGPCLRGRAFAEPEPIILREEPVAPEGGPGGAPDEFGPDALALPLLEGEPGPEPQGAVLASEALEALAAAGASEIALAELDEELHPNRVPPAPASVPTPETSPAGSDSSPAERATESEEGSPNP